MFNMKLIGMKISECRKSKNLTQMELADLLNVSHQAVSNWERGETMPDISKLPELAKIFDTSIDHLLSNEKGLQIIKNVVSGNEVKEITIEEFENVSPLLKPKQIDELSSGIQVEKLEDIIGILPFISTETADQLVKKCIENNDEIGDIIPLLPFISQETADSLVIKSLEKNGQLTNIVPILPFVSMKTREDLVKKIIEEKGLVHDLVPILPFISRDLSNQLVLNHIQQNGDIENIVGILPFVSTEVADQIVLLFTEKGRKIPSHIFPFISKKLADQLIVNVFNKK